MKHIDTPSSLLRRPQVEAITGLSRSSIYALISQGRFPEPVKLSVRSVAWKQDSITSWVESRPSCARGVVKKCTASWSGNPRLI